MLTPILNKHYIKVSLATRKYKLSLLYFLNQQKMLRRKYKEILDSVYEHWQLTTLYLPIKMLSELPFVLSVLNCKEINNCLYDNPTTKLVKKRAENYYCEDFFKKLVSIFGNEKAYDEFDVSKQWKPKLSFAKRSYDCCPYILSPHFNFMQYKLINHAGTRKVTTCWFGVIASWTKEKSPCIEQYNPTCMLDNITKRRISRTLNKLDEKAVGDFRESIHVLENNKKFLSKDGIEMLKDLSLVKILL